MRSTIQKTEPLMAQSLEVSELRYRRLFEAAQDGILILDAKTGAITDVNPFLISMLGYSRRELVQKRLWEVGAFKDVEASKEAFHYLQENEYIRYKNLPLRAKNGQLIQVEFVSNVYWAGHEKVIQCNIRDITERKQAEDELAQSAARLREQSVRDHLTGLFNRRYMEETLERELLRASRRQLSLSLVMLDVDNFKHFNDSYGHAAGDAILRSLGSLLLQHVRGEDFPCRYGGDEFIIVLPDTTREVAQERAEDFCEHARHLQIPFEGQTLEAITFSLGISVCPESGATSDALMKAADTALYRAKHERRGRLASADQASDSRRSASRDDPFVDRLTRS